MCYLWEKSLEIYFIRVLVLLRLVQAKHISIINHIEWIPTVVDFPLSLCAPWCQNMLNTEIH